MGSCLLCSASLSRLCFPLRVSSSCSDHLFLFSAKSNWNKPSLSWWGFPVSGWLTVLPLWPPLLTHTAPAWGAVAGGRGGCWWGQLFLRLLSLSWLMGEHGCELQGTWQQQRVKRRSEAAQTPWEPSFPSFALCVRYSSPNRDNSSYLMQLS